MNDFIENLVTYLAQSGQLPPDPETPSALPALIQAANDAGADLGAALDAAKVTPTQAQGVMRAINAAFDRRSDAAGETFAEAIDHLKLAVDMRANGAVTLLGPGGPGTLYAPGIAINLVPWQNGVPQLQPFALNQDVHVLAAVARKVDTDAGWMIGANSAKLNNEPYSGFQYDTSSVIWDSDTTATRPLASLLTESGPTVQGSPPLQYNIAAILNGGVPKEFGGFTLLLRDNRCPPNGSRKRNTTFLRLLELAQGDGLVNLILDKAQTALRPTKTHLLTPATSRVTGAINKLLRL